MDSAQITRGKNVTTGGDLLLSDPTPTRTCDLLNNCPSEPVSGGRPHTVTETVPMDTVIIIRGSQKSEELVNPAPDCMKIVNGPAVKYYQPELKRYYADPIACQNAVEK